MNHSRAVKVRNALVHLGDHNFGGLDGRLGQVSGDVVAAIAVLIRKRAVDARHINRNLVAADQGRELTKEARDKAAVPLRDILPLVGAQKQAVHKERLLVLRLAERSRTFRDVESRNDVHTPELISTAGQCLLDYHRHGGASLKEDPVT